MSGRGPHTCKPPRYAEDFDQWRCPTCGSWWMANEDDGWTKEPTPTTDGAPHRMTEVKYIRIQVDDHTVAEFRNGSRACSCGLERGVTPSLRPEVGTP